jgi:tetratricopeptide (TPR) repeat protein
MGIRPVLVACLVLSVSPASAAPIEEAKAAFAAGKEAFERGDYELALQNFLRANQLVPAPSLQYNIGNCHERLAHYKEAAAAFERYLELAGPPNTDDERDFQEKLRARIVANKKRSESAQPMPPPVYQQPLYQPPPTYYIPAAPPPPPREYLLKMARGRRTRAIALMATGLALNVIGIALLVDGLVDPHACTGGIDCTIAFSSTSSASNIAEDFFGVTFLVTGITLWAPGAASFVGAEKQIRDLMKEEQRSPMPGTAPKAFLFHSPVIRF